MRSPLLLIACALLSSFCFAARPGATEGTSATCTADVVVNAFDSATKADLHGLQAGDFEARSLGRDYAVVKATPVLHNRVLVLVDARGARSFAQVRAISEMVREQMPPEMPVAFGVIAQQPVITRGFYSDYDVFGAAIQKAFSRSHIASGSKGASLEAALRQGLALFGTAKSGDTVLLITSGTRDEGLKVAKLARRLNEHQVRLQLLMPEENTASENALSVFSSWDAAEHFSSRLLELAARTGGALMGFMNSDWLDAASSGYTLSINLPQNSGKLMKVDLREKQGNADLFYPEQITGCTASYTASAATKTTALP